MLPLPIVELLLHSDYPKRPLKNLEVVGDVKANDGSESIDVEPQLPGSLTEACLFDSSRQFDQTS